MQITEIELERSSLQENFWDLHWLQKHCFQDSSGTELVMIVASQKTYPVYGIFRLMLSQSGPNCLFLSWRMRVVGIDAFNLYFSDFEISIVQSLYQAFLADRCFLCFLRVLPNLTLKHKLSSEFPNFIRSCNKTQSK